MRRSAAGLRDDEPEHEVGDLPRADDPEKQEQDPYKGAAHSEAAGEGAAHAGHDPAFSPARADKCAVDDHAPHATEKRPGASGSSAKPEAGA